MFVQRRNVDYHYFIPRNGTYSKQLSIQQRQSFSFELNLIKFDFFRLGLLVDILYAMFIVDKRLDEPRWYLAWR